jgi:2-dehydro-3-deoxygalactonokinase
MVNGGWDAAAFEQAVKQVMEAPENLAETLFSLRTDMLLADLSSAQACARLSGMLIGFELASTRRYWEAASIVLIGESALCSKYADALVAHSSTWPARCQYTTGECLA